MDNYDLISDDQLLAMYVQQNDRAALGSLFKRHAGQAYSTARRICRNPVDAEDCVQQAFISAMNHAADYRGASEQGIRVWLLKIVAGTCKSRIRGEVRRRSREEIVAEEQEQSYLPDDVDTPVDDLKTKLSEVLRELDSLPEQHRAAIWLRYHEGLSTKDTSEALGISEKTLENQIQYGMKKLRLQLAGRDIKAGAASLALAIPLLQGESAPAALLNGIAETVAQSGVRGGSQALVLSPAVVTAVKIAAAVTFVLGGAYAAFTAVRGGHEKSRDPLVSVGSPALNYHWDFSTPGVPSELKPVEGKLVHVPSGGPDGNGCLELTDAVTEIKIDVPVSNFPVVVTWKDSVIHRSEVVDWMSESYWFPAADIAQIVNLAPLLQETYKPGVQQGSWRDCVDYYSGSCIDRWRGGSRVDMTVCRFEGGGKITLIFRAPHQIDDLRIRSISTNELPDARAYLEGVVNIPLMKRTGLARIPGVKSMRTGKDAEVLFYPRIEKWAYYEKGGK